MKFTFIIIGLLTLFSSHTIVKIEPEEYFMEDCLALDEAKTVDSLVVLFEKKLIKQYGSKSYKMFISDMEEMALPRDFFLHSDLNTYLAENWSNNFFKKIWRKDGKTFILKPNETYFQCLRKHADFKTLSEILNTIESFPDIAPGLVMGAMKTEMQPSNYESKAFKTFIAVNVYCRIAINLDSRF